MRFSKALISFGVASALAVGANFFSARQTEAQSSPNPFVVFVDGSGDCCAYAMTDLQTRLRKDLNATIWKTSYANFRDGSSTQKTPGANLSINSDAAFIAEGAMYINTKLAKNTPLVLIGHSYGGDSVLKLLPLINRPIQFVAVIDPVSTAGFRSTLSRYTVPGTVSYFFNRWQKNEPFPIDFRNDGSIKCNAQKCDDQSEQWNHVGADGNPHREKCGLLETCRTKQVRSGHQTLPTDDWIEKTLGDRISESLVAFRPPANQPRAGYFDNGGTVFYANGTSYCGLVSPKHLEFFRRINQASSLGRQNPSSFGTNAGICTLPSGYFDNGASVFFSAGNGTFCGFRNPQALDSHRRSRPQQPSFGRIDIDPNKFMSYKGVCQ